jgi:hypothetical protein
LFESSRVGPQILGTGSVFYPNTEEIMGWDISESGFKDPPLARKAPGVRRLKGLANRRRARAANFSNWVAFRTDASEGRTDRVRSMNGRSRTYQVIRSISTDHKKREFGNATATCCARIHSRSPNLEAGRVKENPAWLKRDLLDASPSRCWDDRLEGSA